MIASVCPQIQQKLITPAELTQLVRDGKATYVSLEKIKFLNFTLVDYLRGLREANKPIVVNIRSSHDSAYLSDDMLYHFLSHVRAVDYLVDKSEDKAFSLKHTDESFFSNTYFIGEEVSAVTEERIRNMKSFFRKSYKKAEIETSRYLPLKLLQKTVQDYQIEGKSVALVAGVFDVIHEGHIALLEQAAGAADVLIVLTNSDRSASRQAKNSKGDRPIHSLEERIAVLRSLDLPRHITAFDTESILPILEGLNNIVYVKTEKDIGRPSIIQERALVEQRGGSNTTAPYTSTQQGSELSSSAIIKESRRKPYVKFILPSDESWSPTVTKVLLRTAELIKKSSKYKKFLNIKRQLYSSHSLPRTERAAAELHEVQRLVALGREMIREWELTDPYYVFTMPYIMGKLLHFDIRIFSIQHNRTGFPNALVNAVQLIDGRTAFFSLDTGLLADPFIFEDQYYKVMPQYTQYLAKDPQTSFAVRMYGYSVDLHYKALSILILQQLCSQNPARVSAYRAEIAEVAHDVWELMEELPYRPPPRESTRTPISSPRWPGIIAHGGVDTLSSTKPRAENSRTGLVHALNTGIDVVEIDVNPCKDGWILAHEQRLDLGTAGAGLFIEKTEKEATAIHLLTPDGKASSETVITLSEALSLVAEKRQGDQREMCVKIDVKYDHPGSEYRLAQIIGNSGIPLQKILFTTQLVSFNRRMHTLLPGLPFEFNTVETNLYFCAYGLMDEQILLDLYCQYIESYAPRLNAHTVSLAQFALETWGEKVPGALIERLHRSGYTVQVWVAETIEQYRQAADWGADYVLMHDPAVIAAAIELKNS